jgi:hypothetical protein
MSELCEGWGEFKADVEDGVEGRAPFGVGSRQIAVIVRAIDTLDKRISNLEPTVGAKKRGKAE